MTTTNKPSFKELMAQLGEETETSAPVVQIQGKKKLDDRYKFNQGWYDALLNTDMVLCTHNEAAELRAFRPGLVHRWGYVWDSGRPATTDNRAYDL